jgi:hypothetical protein
VSKRTPGARIYLSLVGLALAGIGGVFTWLMLASYLRAKRIDRWDKVPCAIVESTVESRRDDPDWPAAMPQEYRFRVRYEYEWDGATHVGDHYRLRGSSWSSGTEKAEELVATYPQGSVVTCQVNPDQPDEAVLKGESKAPGYSLWFPLLFVVGGTGIVAGAWRR